MKVQSVQAKLTNLFAAVAVAALSACGGGGGSSSSSAAVSSAPTPAPAPAPASSPAPVATTAAGTSPTVSAADCAKIQAASVSAPTVVGTDMQATNDVLAAVDATHGYSEFARLPSTLMWWVRSAGPVVDAASLGAAIHETNHKIDNTLRFICNSDGLARYFADGQTHVTGLTIGSTSNYSIVSETYPASLKSTRASRYDLYITGSAGSSGNDFSILLDELNAYSGGASFEVSLLSNSTYSYLSNSGDFNLGGMTDFMLFMQAYLQSARLNHATSYATIQSQSQTLAYLQFAWTRAERILLAGYRYSTAAGGTQVAPVDVIAAIYSSAFLAELDALGITHKTAADWSSTYLR